MESENYKISRDDYIKGLKIYKAYIFSLAFMPGILSIFYGDELGIEGYGNLANRKPFPWDNINEELLEYFKLIGNIRKKEKFLTEADLNILDINKDYLSFERKTALEKMLVMISRSNEEKQIDIPNEYSKSNQIYTLKKSNKEILTPYGGIAIKK